MVQIWKHLLVIVWRSSHEPREKRLDSWIHHIKTVGNHSLALIHILSHIKNYLPSNFTTVTKSWFKNEKHLLVIVWKSSTQPKVKMFWQLNSPYQNSSKTLFFNNSCTPIHLKLFSNKLYSTDKIMAQVWKTIISYCLKIFFSTKNKNDLRIGFTISKELETTFFQ